MKSVSGHLNEFHKKTSSMWFFYASFLFSRGKIYIWTAAEQGLLGLRKFVQPFL